MPKRDNKKLKCNHGEKSMKAPSILFIDSETLLRKWALVKILMKNHQQHTASGYLLFHFSVDATKNRLDYFRGKHFMKNFLKI